MPMMQINPTRYFWPISEKKGKQAESFLLSQSLNLQCSALASLPKAVLGRVYLEESVYINTLCLNPSLCSLEIPKPMPGQRVMVWAHGFGAGLAFFYKNYPLLQQLDGWTFYAFDWLGMGRSSRVTFPRLSTSTNRVGQAEDFFVESLEKWRQQLELDKMILAGHSFGGYLCSAYAEKYPDRIEQLILISPVGLPDLNHPDAVKHGEFPKGKNYALIKQCWKCNITPQLLIRCLGPYGYKLVGRYVQKYLAYLSSDEQRAFLHYFYHITVAKGSGEYAMYHLLKPGARARSPLIHRLTSLNKRISFIYGESDWMDYRHCLDLKSKLLQPSQVYRVKGGHKMCLENPAEFNQVIIDILSKPI